MIEDVHNLKLEMYEFTISEQITREKLNYYGEMLVDLFSLNKFDKHNPEHVEIFEIKDIYGKLFEKFQQQNLYLYLSYHPFVIEHATHSGICCCMSGGMLYSN